MMHKYLTIGARFFDRRFCFAAGAYAVFLGLVIVVARALEGHGELLFIDHPFLVYVGAVRSDALTSIMRVITALGSGTVVAGLSIAAVAWFLYRRMTVHAMALVASVGGAAFVAAALKRVLGRPRPSAFVAAAEQTFSFPSGHAALSLAFFGILVYFLIRHASRFSLKFLAAAGGVAVIGAIGVSRIYLGAHWPSDVIGSYVLIGVWLVIVIRHMERKCKEV